MSGAVSSKQLSTKAAGPAEGRSTEQGRAPAASGLQASILAWQDAAGNRSVNQLLQWGEHSAPSKGNRVPPIVHQVLRSPGQPLDPTTRNSMEARFGRDLSQVRVHTDTRAGESAQAINARAYTAGRDIVFGTGHYAPKTGVGESLLAHELTHALQQQQGAAQAHCQPKIHDTPGLEAEARRMATGPDADGAAVAVSGKSNYAVQRSPVYVHLLSGRQVSQRDIRRRKKKIISLFDRHSVHLDKTWLVEKRYKRGSRALLLRWQSAWGKPPRKYRGVRYMSLKSLKKLLLDIYIAKIPPYNPGIFAIRPSDFSNRQKRWIEDVKRLREVQLLFSAYKLPSVILRKGKIDGQGKYDKGVITISPTETNKEAFKSTLIHELVHFVKHQTARPGKMTGPGLTTPTTLIDKMIYDKECKYGWYEHPKTRARFHFDSLEKYSADPSVSIQMYSELKEKKEEGQWESSPMPLSGREFSPEEDLAQTISLYLTDNRSRQKLKSKFPKRFELVHKYFRRDLPTIAKGNRRQSMTDN